MVHLVLLITVANRTIPIAIIMMIAIAKMQMYVKLITIGETQPAGSILSGRFEEQKHCRKSNDAQSHAHACDSKCA